MDKKTFEIKYDIAIRSISEKNKVDLGVAFDMFVHNARVLATAVNDAGADWYKGAARIDVDALVTDVKELEKSFKGVE